jgi:hypothetical protein
MGVAMAVGSDDSTFVLLEIEGEMVGFIGELEGYENCSGWVSSTGVNEFEQAANISNINKDRDKVIGFIIPLVN